VVSFIGYLLFVAFFSYKVVLLATSITCYEYYLRTKKVFIWLFNTHIVFIR